MSAAYAVTAPLGSAPDEPEHWRYAWALASDVQPVSRFVQLPRVARWIPRCLLQREAAGDSSLCPRDRGNGSNRRGSDPVLGVPASVLRTRRHPDSCRPGYIGAAVGPSDLRCHRRRHPGRWPSPHGFGANTGPCEPPSPWGRPLWRSTSTGPSTPQGFEIASMAAVWSLTLAFFLSVRDKAIPRWLVAAWPAVVIIALFARPLTWLWVGIALLCCAVACALAPARVLRRRDARIAVLAVVLVLVGFVAVTLWNRARSPLAGVGLVQPEFDVPLGQQLAATAWQGLEQLEESIRLLGWLDVPLPSAVTGVWFLVTGVVLGISLTVARRWQPIAAGLCLLCLLVVWAVTDPIITQQLGMPFWQGRYGAPLLMGVPLLIAAATVAATPHGFRRAITLGCVVSLGAASLIALAYLTVRYVWGPGWYGPVGAPRWAPYSEPALIVSMLGARLVAFLLAVGGTSKAADAPGRIVAGTDDDEPTRPRVSGSGAVRGSRTVRFRFSAPNPDWRSLFPYVLPKHVLAGHDFDQVWRDEIADPVTHEPIGSGPFLVTGWTKGQSLTATRNPRWHGQRPFLDSIEFRVVPSSNDQFQGIRDGSLDLITPQAQIGARGDPQRRGRLGPVARRAPRWSISTSTSGRTRCRSCARPGSARRSCTRSTGRPSRRRRSTPLIPNHPALHNLSFSSVEPDYEPVFAHYVYDPQTVGGSDGRPRLRAGSRRDLVVRRHSRLGQVRHDRRQRPARVRAAADGRAGEGGGHRARPRQLPRTRPLRHEAGGGAVRADHVHVGSRCEPAVGAAVVRLRRRAEPHGLLLAGGHRPGPSCRGRARPRRCVRNSSTTRTGSSPPTYRRSPCSCGRRSSSTGRRSAAPRSIRAASPPGTPRPGGSRDAESRCGGARFRAPPRQPIR